MVAGVPGVEGGGVSHPLRYTAKTTMMIITTAPMIPYIVLLLFGFAGSDGFGVCSIFSHFCARVAPVLL